MRTKKGQELTLRQAWTVMAVLFDRTPRGMCHAVLRLSNAGLLASAVEQRMYRTLQRAVAKRNAKAADVSDFIFPVLSHGEFDGPRIIFARHQARRAR